MAMVTSALMWLKFILASLGVFVTHPIQLFYDNQAILHIAKNPVFHERTKHIEINCHFVCERIVLGDLSVGYIPSKYQLADIFTKAFGSKQFHLLIGKLGIINPHAPI